MLINMCRVCGRSNICEQSFNLFDTENRKLLKHIFLLTGLQLRVLPDAPTYICHCCQSDLRLCMTFRKRCIKTQKKWENHLQIRKDVDWDLNTSMSDTEIMEEKVPQETIQVILKEEVNFQDNLINEENDHVDLDNFHEIEKQDNVHLEPVEKTLRQFEDDLSNGPHDRLNPNKCNDKLADENNGRSLVHDLPKKRRKLKDEVKSFICELCGIHMRTKAALGRHILKHTGERPFGCEECSARFLSAAELRSHHQVHSGGRSFACRFCDRKYVSYMGRLRHERNHTNERNFVCDECGKQFTNNFILKNHMLVHSGERLFSCDVCQRSFQRKTHLRTHFRSNTHQQNMEKQHGKVSICQEVQSLKLLDI